MAAARHLRVENARLREAAVVLDAVEELSTSNGELRAMVAELGSLREALARRRREVDINRGSPRAVAQARREVERAREQAQALAEAAAENDAMRAHQKMRAVVGPDAEDRLREVSASVAALERCALAAARGAADAAAIAVAADAADAAFNVGVLALFDASGTAPPTPASSRAPSVRGA